MSRPQTRPLPNVPQALVKSFAVNEQMNQLVLDQLDPRAWRAKPPGTRTRTIAAIFSHVHNVRCKWLRLSASHLKPPSPLDRARCTKEQARTALAESATRCAEMLTQALLQHDGCIETFHRDGWARPWPVGPLMVTYMITHEAHHRGQACMLAHQLGFPLYESYKIWAWEKF